MEDSSPGLSPISYRPPPSLSPFFHPTRLPVFVLMAYLDVGRIHLVRHKREFLELREARKSMNDSSPKKPFSNELLLSFYREIKSSNTRHRAWEDKRSFYHSSRSGRELFGARKWFRTLEKLAAHPFSLSLSLSRVIFSAVNASNF